MDAIRAYPPLRSRRGGRLFPDVVAVGARSDSGPDAEEVIADQDPAAGPAQQVKLHVRGISDLRRLEFSGPSN